MKNNPLATLAYGAMTMLVAVYIAFVALLMHHDAMPIPVFAGIALAALAALLLGAKACRNVRLDIPEQAGRPNRRAFLLAAGFSVLVYAVYLTAYFPGGFSSDTVYQWRQIRGIMPYTDWHPALHTLLMAALLKLVDHPAFVLAVQGLCYALAVGYTADVLARWRMPRWVVAVVTAYL